MYQRKALGNWFYIFWRAFFTDRIFTDRWNSIRWQCHQQSGIFSPFLSWLSCVGRYKKLSWFCRPLPERIWTLPGKDVVVADNLSGWFFIAYESSDKIVLNHIKKKLKKYQKRMNLTKMHYIHRKYLDGELLRSTGLYWFILATLH